MTVGFNDMIVSSINVGLIVGTSKYICNFKATLEENMKKYL